MKEKISRRELLKNAGAAALLAGAPGCATWPGSSLRTPRDIDPNRKLNIACVGVGGKGNIDIEGLGTENIVALCDVDEKRARTASRKGSNAYMRHPEAARYTDFRKMLAEMDDEIDAVTVSTPDHTHFPAAKMAMEMGKHVFVQKPLAHTVWEARELTRLARKHKVASIMGNQGHALEGIRLMREWIRAGAIGPVHEVHVWTNRPIWPQGLDRPSEVQPVPDTLDWNQWLGTAPSRPYNEAYLPKAWRGWWDFGCGALGDMGCHMMDASFYALDLGSPVSVEAVSSGVNGETAPLWSIITYEFPERNGMPPVTYKWYDGGKKPPRPNELEANREFPRGGQLLVGETGTIMDSTDYCISPRIIPESKMQEFIPKSPPKTIPRVDKGDHYQEWVRACKGGPAAGSNFDYAGPFSEVVLLGNIALRVGEKIEWDGPTMRITNLPEANQYVRNAFRTF